MRAGAGGVRKKSTSKMKIKIMKRIKRKIRSKSKIRRLKGHPAARLS